ncbi:hypothetical protein BGZ46_003969, partial [Entomortierella lignicola]
ITSRHWWRSISQDVQTPLEPEGSKRRRYFRQEDYRARTVDLSCPGRTPSQFCFWQGRI